MLVNNSGRKIKDNNGNYRTADIFLCKLKKGRKYGVEGIAEVEKSAKCLEYFADQGAKFLKTQNVEANFKISKVESLFPIRATIIPADMFGTTKTRSRNE